MKSVAWQEFTKAKKPDRRSCNLIAPQLASACKCFLSIKIARLRSAADLFGGERILRGEPL
jgi:hypothetical protein